MWQDVLLACLCACIADTAATASCCRAAAAASTARFAACCASLHADFAARASSRQHANCCWARCSWAPAAVASACAACSADAASKQSYMDQTPRRMPLYRSPYIVPSRAAALSDAAAPDLHQYSVLTCSMLAWSWPSCCSARRCADCAAASWPASCRSLSAAASACQRASAAAASAT